MDILSFTKKLLQQGGVEKKYVDGITSASSLQTLTEAFTHSSYGSDKNYERLEFKGDAVVNLLATMHIIKRFPDIVSKLWLMRLKFYFVSKPTLASIAVKAGFDSHIRMGFRLPEEPTDVTRMSILEDVVEAFFGALTMLGDELFDTGTGLEISAKVIEPLLSEVVVKLTPEFIFDAKTLLKEVFDSQGWNFVDESFVRSFRERDDTGTPTGGTITAIFIPSPQGPPKRIAHEAAETESESKKRAYNKALYVLKRFYGITQKKDEDTPYTVSTGGVGVGEDAQWPDNYADVKKCLTSLFRKARLSKDVIRYLTRDETVADLYKAFVDKSWSADETTNNQFPLYIGPPIIELCLSHFFSMVDPDASENKMTWTKHVEVSGERFTDFVEQEGLAQYILSDANKPKMTKILIKAILGAVYISLQKRFGDRIAFRQCYRIVLLALTFKPFSLVSIKNCRSLLSDLYIELGKGWNPKKLTTSEPCTVGDVSCHRVTVHGYPKGNRRPDPKNMVALASAEGQTIAEAKEKASCEALEVLSSRYRIRLRRERKQS